MVWKLVHKQTGVEVKKGERLVSWKGESMILNDSVPPLHSASTGRIYVTDAEGRPGSFFPSVCGLEFVSRS